MALFAYRPCSAVWRPFPVECEFQWPAFPTERQVTRALRQMDRMLGSAFEEWPVANESIRKVTDEKGRFAVELNVSAFRPEELAVKIRDREVSIEGHHEERSDQHGSVEQHFVQKFLLPGSALPESVESSLSDDGILSVTAQKKCAVEEVQSRNIPIQSIKN
ncbi:unnamed protein product [Gongylonema pulchrum]|uniref:SHSP domain-containing protein n=1 Tax=Gongylonema pulchrum TaxID=637853 RepID=A0A183DQY3_9BILA|nr:unnamed protein product [Gongylonema pulchrum]